MKKLISLTAILILFINSCKKDEVIECPEPEQHPVYLPLQIGNFWVYQDVRVDTNGNEFPLQKDSLYIAKDTIINGNTYSVFKGTFFPYHFTSNYSDSIVFIYRDSAGYLVDVHGKVQFTLQNFSDTLDSGASYNGVDTIFTWYRKMDPIEHFITLDSWLYKSYDCPTHYDIRLPNTPVPKRVNHSFYSENIGIVLATYGYTMQPGEIEKRLVKYHIEEPQ